MIRVLVPAPLSQALDAADARVRSLSSILATVEARPSSRICIVAVEHWAALSRDALESTVQSTVERWERGEIGAEAAAHEVLRALSTSVEDSTQPA